MRAPKVDHRPDVTSSTTLKGGNASGRSDDPPRRPVLALVMLVAFVLLSTIGYVAVTNNGAGDHAETTRSSGPAPEEHERSGSDPLPEDSDALPLDASRIPASYRISYRSESYARGDEVVSTEILEVDRPFLSRFELRAGSPPGDRLVATRTASFARFEIASGSSSTVLVVPPAVASSDLRFDISLDKAEKDGTVELRERRQVAGRPCQVYRAGGPASTGELVPLEDEDGTYADLCVDVSGLLLEELWVQDGSVLRRRVAVEVDDDPMFSDEHFALAEPDPLSFEDGGGSTRPVDPDTRPRSLTWELPSDRPAPLDGFQRIGRYAVVPPRMEMEIDPNDPNRRRTAGIVDVWVRGIDVVFLDQGGTTGSEPPFDPHPHGWEVELGKLDLGEAFLDFRTNEVRSAYTDGSFVRLYGTLPVTALIEIARSLEPVDGHGLRYLDEVETSEG